MKEHRCKFCHKLLFKANKGVIPVSYVDGFVKGKNDDVCEIEVKCSKCKKINNVEIDYVKEAVKVEFAL